MRNTALPGLQQLRLRAGIERRVERPLGECHVAGGGDERGEVGIGDGVPIDPEAIDRDAMRGPLLRIVRVRSHAERAASNLRHTVGHTGLH